jgi:hypothetical protein
MSLRLNRLRGADRLVAGGAIALSLFMFVFSWFGERVSGTLPGRDVSGLGSSSTGWEAFPVRRWIWLLTIVVALSTIVAIAGGRRLRASLRPGAILLLLGALSCLLILNRIVDHPTTSLNFPGFHASYGIKLGIWLGLLAALAIASGGYLQLRAESVAASSA